MKTKKQMTGDWGEQKAVEFLQKNGYSVLERNFRTRKGEIDIIATHQKVYHGQTLVFIEVKTRERDSGEAERAVGKSKLQNLFQAAKTYCVQKNISVESTPIQFEEVSVIGVFPNVKNIKQYIIPVE